MKYLLKIISVISAFLFFTAAGCEIETENQPDNRIMNLAGEWKFSIGDDEKWSDPKFDDSDWETIKVPSSWENVGFHGYNGYAWYRKQFKLSSSLAGKSIYLHLGYVDDVDATYINGHLIGFSGSFPLQYETAYDAYRKYYVPDQYLNFDGENIISVRVYDSQQAGGIVSGNIGLYSEGDKPIADINLEGEWKFSTKDNPAWKNISFNDKDWASIIVPGNWENQGYRDYDGVAWYRKTFKVDEKFSNEKLVMLVGKIDDFDQVFLNEIMIGSTGVFDDSDLADIDGMQNFALNEDYLQLRGYYIPDGLIKFGKLNTISVRVYDGFRSGGIYEGPVGLMRQSRYKQFWSNRKKSSSLLEGIIEK